WWTNEGQKISKSLGNIIEPLHLVEEYGLDAVRYFLLREVPFGNDGDFSHRAIVGRINGDLANGLGNLAQRVLSMIHKDCGGQVPDPTDKVDLRRDAVVLSALGGAQELIGSLRPIMARQAFHEALESIWEVVREANRNVDEQAPWALKKTDPAQMDAVLYTLAEVLRYLAIILWPFMPDSCDRLLDQLAVPKKERNFACLTTAPDRFRNAYSLKPGTALPKPEGVFPRYVEAKERTA
ncbi:MAG: class I tRNA ligase family protein, partial [Alphaproteobacteria bacterium]